METGKPMMPSLAMAYAIKKRNAKKMSSGGMVNETLSQASASHGSDKMEGHIDMDAMVDAIMAKKMAKGGMCMADGGMVEMDDNFGGEDEPGYAPEDNGINERADEMLGDASVDSKKAKMRAMIRQAMMG